MLKKYADEKRILELLTDIQLYHSLTDRDYWEGVKPALYDALQASKEKYDGYVFEPLYASLWMQYTTMQNRVNYEAKQFDRRIALNTYVFLEAIENEGKHIGRILDLVWMILEESEWALPAHVHNTPGNDALPDVRHPTVCLFSAFLAQQLTFVSFLFEEKFNAISRHIVPRIKNEVMRRVVDDYLTRNDYWYFGFNPSRKTNNWTSAVNMGVLSAAAVLLRDEKEKLAKVVAKVLITSSNQINDYPDDGGCDEGPGYWIGSTANLVQVLDIVRRLTGGVIDPLAEPKIQNIGNYFSSMYIYGSYLVSVADCDALRSMLDPSLFTIGKHLSNDNLLAIVYDAYERGETGYSMCDVNTGGILDAAEMLMEMRRGRTVPPFLPRKSNYLASIQIATARESDTDRSGLFFAAKGGHNKESHNHNDVGNFIVYKDGERFLCDTGRPSYDAVVFSRARYTKWMFQSGYHNLPTVNGHDQTGHFEEGNYAAKNALFSEDDATVSFSLDISEAYANRADIEKWERRFVFDREKSAIRVTEDYALKICESVTLNFIAAAPFTVGDGVITMRSGDASLGIYTDTSLFDIQAETIDFKGDGAFLYRWSGGLYRLRLTLKKPKAADIITYTIK